MPPHYIRRQTLKNAERYIIPELKEHEDKVLNSKSKALALEKKLWEQLFDLLLPQLDQLQNLASALSQLDVCKTLQSARKALIIAVLFSVIILVFEFRGPSPSRRTGDG